MAKEHKGLKMFRISIGPSVDGYSRDLMIISMLNTNSSSCEKPQRSLLQLDAQLAQSVYLKT